jgi:cytosine deaminase
MRTSLAGTTLYTTLSPCSMCAGAIDFLRIERVVVGERLTYTGELPFRISRGVKVTLLNDQACIDLLAKFIAEKPNIWNRIVAG